MAAPYSVPNVPLLDPRALQPRAASGVRAAYVALPRVDGVAGQPEMRESLGRLRGAGACHTRRYTGDARVRPSVYVSVFGSLSV